MELQTDPLLHLALAREETRVAEATVKKPASFTARTISVFALLLILAAAGSSVPGQPPDQEVPVESTDAPRAHRTLEDARGLLDEGRYEEAENLARAILAEVERSESGESPEVADVLDLLVEALFRAGKSRQSETLAFAERSLAIRENALGPDHPEVAGSLVGLAMVRGYVGELQEAEQHLERARRIRESVLGDEHPEVAAVLSHLGTVLRKQGQYEEARTLLERALETQERAYGETDPRVATTLWNLAIVLSIMGSREEATPLHERALAIREEALGPEHPDVGHSTNSLAIGAIMRGDHQQARALWERTLEIWRKSLGTEHPEVATVLGNLGNLSAEMGDDTGACGLYREALVINEKAYGPDHPRVALNLNNLAISVNNLGDHSEARALHERALAIRERSLGPSHPDRAQSLSNLANVLLDSGDYTGARQLLERALEIQQQAFGPSHPAVAKTLNNLAILTRKLGDHEAARSLSERALAMREKIFGPEHPEVAQSLGNMAVVLREAGDFEGARPLVERALSILEKTFGPDHPGLAGNLNILAELAHEAGDDDEARSLMNRALAIREKTHGPDHPTVAESLGSHLGQLLVSTGEYSEAILRFNRALEIRDQAFGSEHPLVGDSLRKLADVLGLAGRGEEAFEAAQRAARVLGEHLRLTVRALTEERALSYAGERRAALDLVLSLAVQRADGAPDVREQTWNSLIPSRAVVFDEMAKRNRAIAGTADPEISRLARELDSARQRLADLTVRGVEDRSVDAHRDSLAEARVARARAEQALADRSDAFAEELSKQQPTLSEIDRSLPPGGALVAFVRYTHHDFARRSRQGNSGAAQQSPDSPTVRECRTTPSYVAFVHRQGWDHAALVSLGPAAEIEQLVRRWGQEAARGLQAPGWTPQAAEKAYRETGEALRKKVWDPIASHLADAELVFVVPDGALHQVSLAALPAGDEQYLVEVGPPIHYLSAERDLVGVGGPTGAGGGILAMGAPAFDAVSPFASLSPDGAGKDRQEGVLTAQASFRGSRSSCGDFESLEFDPLPASGREIDDVMAQWRKGRSAREETSPLTGAEASEAAFKAMAPGKEVLHIATHGFFLNGRCPPAAEDTQKTSGQHALRSHDELPPVGENPLLLSGLAFAGANHREAAGPDEDDGILTAEEVAAVDLSAAAWVVLSACDTGVGEVRAGEGVFGLRRAFQIAGARTLITSLWPVEDEAGRQWMRDLYKNRFVKGLGTAESVRAAGLEVLRQRRAAKRSTHPFYWAGFVASGDWR